LAIRSSRNLIPLSMKLMCAVSRAASAFHTPYVMLDPTAVIAAAMWMNFSSV